MFGVQITAKRRGKDEAEKPFWISFADMMTAMMVLFLVVMAVALLAVTKTVTEREKREDQHRKDIETILSRFEKASKRYDGIKVDKQRRVIDFGEQARFAFRESTLHPRDAAAIRQFVPEILTLSNDDLGQRVLKRIVVEGYTDKTGPYLINLNLSLMRSQRVLCAMFENSGANVLTDTQKEDVRSLFLVGGYSFNAAKSTPEESRRVEMRLEFLGVGEQRPSAGDVPNGNFGTCALK